jgi:hypothetical protein
MALLALASRQGRHFSIATVHGRVMEMPVRCKLATHAKPCLDTARNASYALHRKTAQERGHAMGAETMTGSCHCGDAGWILTGDPGSITACNCTLCRRLGALWAYDYEDGRITVRGPTQSYTRRGKANPALEIHFCPTCACVTHWRGARLEDDGRRRIAVNVRLASPDVVAHLPIDHFDGLDTFEDLPGDGRCVRDLWS